MTSEELIKQDLEKILNVRQLLWNDILNFEHENTSDLYKITRIKELAIEGKITTYYDSDTNWSYLKWKNTLKLEV